MAKKTKKRNTFKAWMVTGTEMVHPGNPIRRFAESRDDARRNARSWRAWGDKTARAARVLITEIGRA